MSSVKESNFKGWFSTLVGALFFFYAFIQCNMMTPLTPYLKEAFQASTSGIGLVAGFYFYANVLFMIPAGLILDRVSIKIIFLFNLLLAITSSLIFLMADGLFMIGVARFLAGIMMSFGLIACIKLASLVLEPKHMALASSLIVTIGMIGGIFSQAPMSLIMAAYGWRNALLGNAVLGGVIALIIGVVIKKPPKMQKLEERAHALGIFESLKSVVKNSQNWYAGLFTTFLNFPVAVLGALFGVVHLTTAYKMNEVQAASIVSMLFFGMLLGSPFFGWLSDSFRKRKPVMYLGAGLCLLFLSIFLYWDGLSVAYLYVLMFLTGFASGAQVLGYPVVSESNQPSLTGTALSLAGILIMGLGYGVMLPITGYLLDLTEGAYSLAFIALPCGVFLSLFMAILLKETGCKPNY